MRVLSWLSSIIIFLLFIPGIAHSQVTELDSLTNALENTDQDSVKAEILMQLGSISEGSSEELSYSYYKEAASLNIIKRRKGEIYNTLAMKYWRGGLFEESVTYNLSALDIFKELGDSIWIGRLSNNLASNKWRMGALNEALDYYNTGLKIRRAINDLLGTSYTLNNIGLVYQDWGLFDEAIKWHNEALDIAIDIDHSYATAYSYANLGDCYRSTLKLDSALILHKLAYKIYLDNESDGRSTSFFLANIGLAFQSLAMPDSALIYFQNSLVQANKISNQNRIAIAEYNLGETYLKLGKTDKAKGYILSSYDRSRENSYSDILMNSQFLLAEIEESEGKFEEALLHLTNASSLKDSIFNKKELSKFTELNSKFILEHEEEETAFLRRSVEMQELVIRKQNIIRWILIGGGLGILLVLLLINRNRASIKKLNSQLLESQKELQQANADKDKFFSIISHDLKSPYGGLLGISELLDSEYDSLSQDQVKDYLATLKRTAYNSYNLLDGLLQWTMTETGRMEYVFEDLDLRASLESIISLTAPEVEAKNLVLENNLQSSIFVYASRNSIETVLRNLIGNAIKFTPAGGKISIDCEEKKDEIIISVSDTGVGIDKATLDGIFNLGNYNSTEGTEGEIGTGLGLYLCKELVEKHDGSLWAESKPGKGSTFYFNLKPVRATINN